MSRYSSPQNQEMLWNIINKNEIIEQHFTYKSLEYKHNWFKTIIRMFYEKYNGQQITTPILTTINKETIAYMIQDIRSQYAVQSHIPVQTTTINTPSIIPDNTQLDQTQGYNMRVKDYEQMNMKQTPADINFSDKQDEHIDTDNMNNMLKMHMEQRKNELQLFKPLQVSPTNSNNMSIKILEPISIDSQEIIIDNDKKTVSWDVNTETNVEIKEIKENIIVLFKELELIKNMVITNIIPKTT